MDINVTKEIFKGMTSDEISGAFDELFNISSNYLFRNSAKVVMMTDQVEAYFLFKLILLIWNKGGGEPFFGSKKGYRVLTKVGSCAFNVGAVCPRCQRTSIINSPFGFHIISLAMRYFDQNDLDYIGSDDVLPDFADILKLVKNGTLAGKFDYECTHCNFQMVYETYTIEKEESGEEHKGVLDTLLIKPDKKITVQDGVGFVLFPANYFEEMMSNL